MLYDNFKTLEWQFLHFESIQEHFCDSFYCLKKEQSCRFYLPILRNVEESIFTLFVEIAAACSFLYLLNLYVAKSFQTHCGSQK